MANTISIDLDPIIKKAKDDAIHQAESSIKQTSNLAVRNLMDSGRYFGKKEGLGHEIIRKHVEDYILSDEFGKKIDQIIEEEAEGQMRSALRVLLHSKTRKVLFEATESAAES